MGFELFSSTGDWCARGQPYAHPALQPGAYREDFQHPGQCDRSAEVPESRVAHPRPDQHSWMEACGGTVNRACTMAWGGDSLCSTDQPLGGLRLAGPVLLGPEREPLSSAVLASPLCPVWFRAPQQAWPSAWPQASGQASAPHTWRSAHRQAAKPRGLRCLLPSTRSSC